MITFLSYHLIKRQASQISFDISQQSMQQPKNSEYDQEIPQS